MEVSNINLALAFAAGAVSFLSPCCLPLVPGYLSIVAPKAPETKPRTPTVQSHGRSASIPRMLLFLLGFISVFVLLGLTASAVGQALNLNRPWLSLVAGSLVIAMGLLMLKPQGLAFPLLARPAARAAGRITGAGPLLGGSAFAIAWTPCIGPLLGAVLALAATDASLVSAAALLLVYAIGLSVPFLLVGLAFNRLYGRLRVASRLRRIVNTVGALVLIAMGLLLASDRLFIVNIALQRMAARWGLDFWVLL